MEGALLVTLAAVLFIATDMDDLFLLAAFFADPRYRAGEIWAGQYLGIALLFAASAALSMVSLVIEPQHLRWLGLAPIAIGARQLLALRAAQRDEGAAAEAAAPRGAGNVLAVAVVTVANGGDNLAVYVPVFATRSGGEIAAIALVFAPLVALWCAAAQWLTRHASLGAPIRRYAHVATPVVLVLLGLWILLGSELPRSRP